MQKKQKKGKNRRGEQEIEEERMGKNERGRGWMMGAEWEGGSPITI